MGGEGRKEGKRREKIRMKKKMMRAAQIKQTKTKISPEVIEGCLDYC